MDAVGEKPVIILVVGNEDHEKIGVVESLTSHGDWDERETAGVRILSSKSTARTVVDTTPLKNREGRSPTAIARRWISRNGLRRILFGKHVVVVCVITCKVREMCEWSMFHFAQCWVDVFGLIFKDQKEAIMMLVNTEGKEMLGELDKSKVEHFVVEHGFSKHNITYSNLQGGDDSVSKVVADSIRLNKTPSGKLSRLQSFLSNSSQLDRSKVGSRHGGNVEQPTVKPFFMEQVSSEHQRFAPWGPERVILFGRTGSGKSTLAQMLTLGALDRENKKFFSSSGVRGATERVEHGEGRGWYVVDTPGFGEPRGSGSTISTQEVEKKIKKYVKLVEGTFAHYVFVFKRDRLDQLDERLWEFFMLLFGEEIKQQFSVVVSNADSEWVEENKSVLEACFKGCESFLSAEFPAVDEEDEEMESEYQSVRTESLLKLEENLAKLNRGDMHCEYGNKSKMHILNERDRGHLDNGIEKDLRIKFLNEGADACFAVSSFVSMLISPIKELTSALTLDDSIALLPS